METKYDALLDEHEQEAKLDCGCRLVRNEETGAGVVEFYFCTMHGKETPLSFGFLPPTPRQVMLAVSHLSDAQETTDDAQVHKIINRAKGMLGQLLLGPLKAGGPSLSPLLRPRERPRKNRSG